MYMRLSIPTLRSRLRRSAEWRELGVTVVVDWTSRDQLAVVNWVKVSSEMSEFKRKIPTPTTYISDILVDVVYVNQSVAFIWINISRTSDLLLDNLDELLNSNNITEKVTNSSYGWWRFWGQDSAEISTTANNASLCEKRSSIFY